MRLTLTVGSIVVLDLAVLEPTEEAAVDSVTGATLERATEPAPFGFRPTPDPWPPSWE